MNAFSMLQISGSSEPGVSGNKVAESRIAASGSAAGEEYDDATGFEWAVGALVAATGVVAESATMAS